MNSLFELDMLLAELKAIYIETDLNSKEALFSDLQAAKTNSLNKNNLYEMKIARAKQYCNDTHKCVFAVEVDAYIILHKNYPIINYIKDNHIHFEYSEYFGYALQVDLFDFVSGPTEDLAWLNYYNNKLAKS